MLESLLADQEAAGWQYRRPGRGDCEDRPPFLPGLEGVLLQPTTKTLCKCSMSRQDRADWQLEITAVQEKLSLAGVGKIGRITRRRALRNCINWQLWTQVSWSRLSRCWVCRHCEQDLLPKSGRLAAASWSKVAVSLLLWLWLLVVVVVLLLLTLYEVKMARRADGRVHGLSIKPTTPAARNSRLLVPRKRRSLSRADERFAF